MRQSLSVERISTLGIQVSRLDHLLVCRSIGLCVCLCVRKVLWQNGPLHPDAVWGVEWGRFRHSCIRWSSGAPRGRAVSGVSFPHCLGADVSRHFKPNAPNIQTFISWKLLHGFQQNFA